MLPVPTSNVQEINFHRENIQVKKYSYYCLEQGMFPVGELSTTG